MKYFYKIVHIYFERGILMRELPRVNIYDDFYIWFDLEEKKEHYATPLYLYNVKRDRIDPDDKTIRHHS